MTNAFSTAGESLSRATDATGTDGGPPSRRGAGPRLRSSAGRLARWALLAAGLPVTPLRPAGAQSTMPAEDESRWLRNIRQVTRDEMGITRAGEAYFSPDGRRIAFQAWPAGKEAYQIYVMDLERPVPEMVSTGQGATTCAYFHPDGRRLIFASNHLDQRPAVMPEEIRQRVEKLGSAAASRYTWPFPPGMDIFEYTFETKSLRQITRSDGYDAEGSYSPDGRFIVFTSMRDGDQEIYICDADGGHPRRITHAPGYDGGPFFSPDGQRIVYRSDRVGDGNMQIFINNTAGTDERAITGRDVLHWCPFWHPSGKWIIFTRADHGTPEQPKRPNYDLYLIRDDGSTMLRVTTDPAFDGLPAFSPDGSRLMWTSRRGGLSSPHIFIADFVGLTPAGALRAGD